MMKTREKESEEKNETRDLIMKLENDHYSIEPTALLKKSLFMTCVLRRLFREPI